MPSKREAAKKKSTLSDFLSKIMTVGTVLIFAVIPLIYFQGRIASYITSKEFFLMGCVDILICVWVWLLAKDERYRLSRTNVLMLAPLFLLLVSLTVSSIFGVDPATSFWSTLETGTGLIVLWHIFIFVCMVVSLIRVKGEPYFKNILQANLLGGVILSILTFLARYDVHPTSYMLKNSAGGATMGNVLLAAAYLIFSCFLGLILIGKEELREKKFLYIMGVLALFASPAFLNDALWEGTISLGKAFSSPTLFIGEARIAAVSLAIGLCFSLVIWIALAGEKKITKALGVMGIVILVAAVGFGIVDMFSAGTSLNNVLVTESGNRIIFWHEAVEGIKDRPILGWGQENYRDVYQKYLDPAVFDPGRGNEVWNYHPHNEFLEILVEGGIVGFIFYLGFLGTLIGGIIFLYRKKVIGSGTCALLIGMVIAYVLQDQMIYDSIASYFILFSTFGVVAGFSQMTTEPESNKGVVVTWGAGILALVVTIVMIPVWVFAAYLPSRKVIEIQSIADMASNQRISLYQSLFHSAGSYILTTDIPFYADALSFSYENQEVQLKNNPAYQKISTEELQALIVSMESVWQKRPMDYRLSLSLLQLEDLEIYISGQSTPDQIAQSKAYALRAIGLSPTDPQVYTYYAQLLFDANDFVNAKLMAQKAIAQNPYYLTAQQLLIAIEKSSGNPEDVSVAIKEAKVYFPTQQF